ncbi:hypothetical protein C1H46_009228 [Malus baccata]|uniref:Myb/SANT-like domain-containing protein n=1 Tax=Malus baccata TaxID=106549 RepID=A0A540N201_MALBA|nr:hypothetical protein C1H46_009228 [Malus baccata]
MSNQNPTSGDRLRTSWTPAMERYFIDLMLDQVHRGNRLGHTFNKQAWNDMLMMFNGNFGTPYDMNTLKSHYTSLWRQFNDIKNLLDQNGFSWDNTRQMVIADKYAWDTYVKVHPDAQVYRNKALMTFNDLCLIYAHTQADGRYSLSSHDIDFDDEIQGMIDGAGMISPTPASKVKRNADWKPAMDEFFLNLMLDQLEKGSKMNNMFTKQAWKDMVTLFKKKFGSQYQTRFLKQLHKKLLKYYTDVRSILARKGFYWDENRQMIVADDDVWGNCIQALPDARVYRKKPLLNYQDLNSIYASEISNGLLNHLDQDEEEREGQFSFSGNGHLASFEDLDSEGLDFMTDGEDIQSHGNDIFSRKDWTPPMDRYLIDLLLEQLQKANKIDYSLDDQAWVDVLVLFKERFGLQYNKDLLRSRYKSLEKQYHDTKDLLDRRGFWWDETQQMVTAYDDVWDAYIKERPDTEANRTKSTPNYNDLCLIYGNSNSGERYNQSGQAMGCNGDANYNHSYHRRTDWTPPMDRYFIDLMLEQVHNGSMVNQKFSKLAWTDMVSKFRAQFGSQHDKDVLKSRFVNLRKRFNDMKTLLDQSGFTWDEMQQRITADGDLWDAHVKVRPDARSYRNRTLPNFNDLCLIYGNEDSLKRESSSNYSMDAEDDDPRVNVGDETQQTIFAEVDDVWDAYVKDHPYQPAYGNSILDYNDSTMIYGNGVADGRSSYLSTEMGKTGFDMTFGGLQSRTMDYETSIQRKKRKPTASSTSASKRVQRTIKEEVQETLDEKPQRVNGFVGNEEDKDCCSIERIVYALETVPDMNDELFLEASQILEDESKAKMFVAMDVTARQKWLFRKLRR